MNELGTLSITPEAKARLSKKREITLTMVNLNACNG